MKKTPIAASANSTATPPITATVRPPPPPSAGVSSFHCGPRRPDFVSLTGASSATHGAGVVRGLDGPGPAGGRSPNMMVPPASAGVSGTSPGRLLARGVSCG